ncbi:MAG: hypothetical protein K2H90_08325 [Oscillospiraceae bacterium]|nr:hypothetical protein [Oscillospiraceae bacterium]
MKKEPIFYDENRPLAHYAAAGKLRKSSEKAILFGKIYPLVILPLGVACAIFEPFSMALFTLFGALFTVLAYIGCGVKRIGPTMAAIPLAIAAAAVLCMTGSDFSIIGGVLYFLAAAGQFRALYAISSINMLKALPGFPFFDPAMDDISFAAMEHHGADEYIEGELVEERTERIKLVPIEPPSEEMGEIVAEEIEASEDIAEVPQERENEPTVYEKMINIQVPEREEVSDIDLFG